MKIQSCEVAQEIAVRQFLHGKGLGGKTSRNIGRDMRRKEAIRERIERDAARSIAVHDGPSEHEINRERVDTILSRLDGRDRQIAEAIMRGETWNEIAQQLGCAKKTIAAALRRMGE